ncbi:5-(carboxyamino)imidazole ribonucleotide synthase [Conexibacter sp. W3-3-2]|uniref:N5-carboxyaminoimidazole ribonucleotide synthase n=1 Tax=Paraconexibacter algicola TaxID=2133960 RepID=A0A2T4UCP8_9ACTN|nr:MULTISPECIES: 5-(carboxyamino)imidazole ribonucleotide synthase [Solirubrobacterales]MTD43254.1 5-(carboxyamino)imidazole ribonucleotide synthase [Conexibacter sp. W3-3-2]PTL54998.1 5-(carboxyamino)imidazole ribonucleotide synthase [Paraconexibacter algicola]
MSKRSAPPTARVGLVGAGQLARMSHQAAIGLGVQVVALGSAADSAAGAAGARLIEGSGHDAGDLRALAEAVDVVSYEIEHVDLDALEALAQEGVVVRPHPRVMRLAADKAHARAEFVRLGFPVPDHTLVDDAQQLAAAGDTLGWPLVLKTPTGGYDGRGVWVCDDLAEATGVLEQVGRTMLAERLVAIDREIAVIVARRPGGQVATFPVLRTYQEDGICREVVAAAGDAEPAAVALAERLAEAVGLEGLMAVELFDEGGELLICELALRPHNTGHLSIDGCVTSQFEQHLRAVLDWPLGDPALVAPAAAMVNVLGPADGGDPARGLPDALAVPGAHVHLYGKAPAAGRKLGHVNATGPDPDTALATARAAAEALA